MSKFTNFVVGSIVGAAAGFVAGSLLVSDKQLANVKSKLKHNEKLQNLKRKYDNGTEMVKHQLNSFPKKVDDDSEIKDFDDIVIDDSKGKEENDAEEAADDLHDAEKDSTTDDSSLNDDETSETDKN